MSSSRYVDRYFDNTKDHNANARDGLKNLFGEELDLFPRSHMSLQEIYVRAMFCVPGSSDTNIDGPNRINNKDFCLYHVSDIHCCSCLRSMRYDRR